MDFSSASIQGREAVPAEAASSKQPPNGQYIVRGLALVLLVLLAYFPILKGGFVWDDVENVTNNPALRSLGGLEHIWLKRGSAQQYYPLTDSTYWFDYHLWGLKPFGYHLENVLLHGLGALLLWRVLKRLDVRGAWLGAALFALHPVCVESVAWVTERRNMLSLVFVLVSVLAALRFWLPNLAPSRFTTGNRQRDGQPAGFPGPWIYYGLALAFFMCALWSKTAAVGAPAIILLIVWWKRGDLGRRSLALFVPFLMGGLMMALITIHIEGKLGVLGKEWDLSLLQRCLLAGRAGWFYLSKLLWPRPLMIIYPHWDVQYTGFLVCLPLFAAAGCFCLFWVRRNDWGRPALVAMGCFAAMLFPVLGFFNVAFFRFSFVSDHFQYLACAAPLALAGAGITAALERFKPRSTVFISAVGGMLLLSLGFLTWRQAHDYLSEESLWRAVVRWNPDAWAAQNNLARVLIEQGKLDEAMPHLNESVRVKPDYPDALNNQGLILVRKGDIAGGIRHYLAAIQLDANYIPAQFNIGLALIKKGSFGEAGKHFTKCLELVPNDFRMHFNLGRALAGEGKLDEAIAHYSRAIELNPYFGEAYKDKGIALAKMASLDPALDCLRQAIRLDPKDAETCYNLGLVLAGLHRSAEAVEQYRQALALNPRIWEAQNNLAWILASDPNPQVRDGAEAVRLAEAACRLTDNRVAMAMETLGAAYAEAGRFDDAVNAAKRAEALARAVGDGQLADKNHKMAGLFGTKQPYRE